MNWWLIGSLIVGCFAAAFVVFYRLFWIVFEGVHSDPKEYEKMKAAYLDLAEDMDPEFRDPFMSFLENDLDAIYEKAGFDAAMVACYVRLQTVIVQTVVDAMPETVKIGVYERVAKVANEAAVYLLDNEELWCVTRSIHQLEQGFDTSDRTILLKIDEYLRHRRALGKDVAIALMDERGFPSEGMVWDTGGEGEDRTIESPAD